VLAVDASWRAQLQDVEALRGKQKAANTEMAAMPKGSPQFIAKVAEMKAVSAQLKEREQQLKEIEEKFRQAMLTVPNLPHASVPEGRTPEENVVFALHGSHEQPLPHALPHWEIPGFEKLFDFARGAKVTGAGFPFYVGDGAYGELSGATAVGMTAVLIRDPADAAVEALRPEAEDWDVVVEDLREIAALVFDDV
jgi:seryl-tRNA synthetase